MGVGGLYVRSGDEFVVNTVTAGDQSAPQIATLASGGFVAAWVEGDQYSADARAVAQIYDADGVRVGGEIELESGSNPYFSPQVTGLSGGGFIVAWRDVATSSTVMQIFDAAGARVGGEIATGIGPGGLASCAALANNRFVVVGLHDGIGQVYDGAGNTVGSTFALVHLDYSANAVVEGLAGGGFVVAGRIDESDDIARRGIALQLFDANGAKIGSQVEFPTTYHNPTQIDIARLANGGFALSWMDSSISTVFTRVFDAGGNAVTGIMVAVQARAEVGQPDIVSTADGGFFLTWGEGSEGGAIATNIFGQFFNAAGAAVGERFQVSQLTDHPNRNHETSSSALLASGEIVTLWHGAGPGDPREPGLPPADAGGGIRGQIIAPLATLPMIEVTASATTVNEAATENLSALLLRAGSDAVNADYTFALVGDSSGGAFALDGDRLVLADGQRLDAEIDSVVTVTIRATDHAGNWVDRAIELTVADDILERRYAAGEEMLVSVERTWTQSQPAVASLDTGGCVVVWTHGGWSGDGTGSAVYAQLYDADGAAVGEAFRVNTYTSAMQDTPTVTALEGGGFLVAWSSSASGGGEDIRGQRFESDGTMVGDELVVGASAESSLRPSVVALEGGGAAVVWMESTGFGSEVNLQLLDAAGAAVGPVRLVNTTTAGWQLGPDIAVLDDGCFVVSWTDGNPSTSAGSIVIQRLDSAGNKLGGEVLVSSANPGAQMQSSIVAIDGGFVVTWRGGGAIKAQVFDLAGQPVGGPIAVAASGLDPFVTALPGDGFVVAWTSYAGASTGDPYGTSVMMQAFNSAGVPVGTSQALNAITPGNQNDPSLAALADGTLALVWTDQSRSYQLGDVKLRLFEPQQPEMVGTESAEIIVAPTGGGLVFGKAGNDTLIGLAGDNTLIGGLGNDTMAGGLGDDTYYVDSVGDVVNEFVGQGSDRVLARVSYTLTAGSAVETLAAIDPAATAAITLTGNSGANAIIGNAGVNVLNGGGGADALSGLGGNDTLVGGAGSDAMAGGLGDDWYYVDNVLDSVSEGASEGANDRVFTSVSYTLGAGVYVEKLSTTDNAGTGAINLTGNALAQTIYGNAGNNVLNGAGGADTLAGLGGDDSYHVDNAGDVVSEGAGGGNDRVFASASWTLTAGAQIERLSTVDNNATTAINLTGNELANVIYGNAGANLLDGRDGNDTLVGLDGNDTLVGGLGNDTLTGGLGDDLYYIDSAGDVVNEVAGQGTADRVLTGVSYALNPSAEIEVLTTSNNAGTGAINLTGNALANTIYGNAGANVLDGRGGTDTLVGFGGDDRYYVDNAGDVVSEAAGGGNDRVLASVSYTLSAAAQVELMTTANNAGTTAIDLTGNGFANTIYGNAGANVLDGKGGADVLVGLEGADRFAFTTALGGGNVDTVSGFSVADDTIVLENAVFAGLATGALEAGAFATGAAASQADDRIVYNGATGALLFDADGSGAGAAVQFATLAGGLALTSADVLVI